MTDWNEKKTERTRIDIPFWISISLQELGHNFYKFIAQKCYCYFANARIKSTQRSLSLSRSLMLSIELSASNTSEERERETDRDIQQRTTNIVRAFDRRSTQKMETNT